jgi:hypothetical protein
MRELNVNELEHVSGGPIDAGTALDGYGLAIASGAVVGLISGGPGGMVIGAVVGAGRAAIGAGVVIIGGVANGNIGGKPKPKPAPVDPE